MGPKKRHNLDDLRFWMTTCGCPKPALHYSSDFNARVCQNCGVILTAEVGAEPVEKIYTADVPPPKAWPFVHLRVHTHLSLMKAICKHKELIKIAKEWGMPALAKTEFGNMCGTPTFVKACQDAGIKPIVGVEFNVRFDAMVYPVTFLALNREGYSQIVKLTTTAWCVRRNKADGIHILSTDIPVSHNIVALIEAGGDQNTAGMANHAVGFTRQRIETFVEVNKDSQAVSANAKGISNNHGCKIVATGNVLYTREEDKDAYGMALKIGKSSREYHAPEHIDNWFKPADRFSSLFGFEEEWATNTVEIADRVQDYQLVVKDPVIPTYKDKGKEFTDPVEVHRRLEVECWRGLYEKGKASDEKYQKRLQHELNVMKDKKFSSYFLIIGEIVSDMKRRGIMVPFGRGSSVGSLVCYALDIITMDPLQWSVPFERFINAGRKDLPDIDTDISQERRGEVLRHIAEVHGGDRVAHIATFQTLKLRASIENVGRAYDVPRPVHGDIRREIPEETEEWDDLPDIVKNKVKDLTKTQPKWIDIALALNGAAKNLGYHAAGVVIANQSLSDLVPLIPPEEEGGLIGIQYDMHDCEVLGLLKLDMLGLRNIDIIQHTVDRIRARRGIDLNVYNLPPNDPDTYKLISNAKYVSIFQLDSTGYRRLCRQLLPDRFEHVMALNALFRPGPLEGGMTDEYVERRHNRRELVGWHPWLDEVLSTTYQVPLFQEQVMSISKIIAGFNDMEADDYRKAIGKKDAEKFAAAQKKFKERALVVKGLVPPSGWEGTLEGWIDDLLQKLAGYARYGWNIGHSCGYGWITYVTAYLETHYSREYYASLLDAFSSSSSGRKKLPILLRAMIASNCKIVPPQINESVLNYDVGSDDNIYMGFTAVRGVVKAADEIIEERKKGKFTSFIEFCQRLPGINKTAKINLVKAGAFSWDKMLCDRDKVDNIDVIQNTVKKKNKKFDGSKISPYQIVMMLESVNGHEYTELERSNNEREILTSYITGHPAHVYYELSPHLERGNTRVVTPSQITPEEVSVGESVLMVGMVDFVKSKMTNPTEWRPSSPYLNISVSDNMGFIVFNIWAPLSEAVHSKLVEGQMAMFECVVKQDKFHDDMLTLKVEQAIPLNHGLPIQGVFRVDGTNPSSVVERIGGMVNNIHKVGHRQFASIRGRVIVQPHVLSSAIEEFGDDVKYLVSMEANEG